MVRGTPLAQLGRSRLPTVYMPGYKITMLPDEVVQIYTLDEGRANPAVSLYVTVDEATLETTASETRLERVPVQVNFRHDKLEDRKSTRLNSSHLVISYAVFCLKK